MNWASFVTKNNVGPYFNTKWYDRIGFFRNQEQCGPYFNSKSYDRMYSFIDVLEIHFI